jgi:hypothetical protein
MSTPLLYSEYVSVKHYGTLSGNKLGYTVDSSLQAVPVNIQPASAEVSALMGGAFGKSYLVFTTCSGILEGDKLTTVSGTISKNFIVKGLENYNYGPFQHQELYVEKVV